MHQGVIGNGLAALKARLAARAQPEDRFDRLVPPWQTLDLGMELMDKALTLPSARKQRELQYRDGLLLALLSLWLIRRRSIAVLTVSRHLEFDAGGVNILLYPEDTKAKRAENFRVPGPAPALSPALFERDTPSPAWSQQP